jgi:APA family basic amino acid/polyamine antiporter
MEAIETISEMRSAQSGKLLRILGVGFGVAVGIGGTIGVGILRNPSGVAEQLGSFWLIMLAWTLGGVYCLLGANYLAELATMIPKAGGFYVYATRAFGRYGGFVVGWSDWLNNTLGLGFISIVFGEYAAKLFAPNLAGGRIIFSVSVLVVITILNLIGLRAGSEIQKITSFLKAVALIGFVVACFLFGGQNNPADTAQSAAAVPTEFSSSLIAFILAIQLVLGTYDGWYSAIYFSEEDTNPRQNLPRSMFGGIAAIIAIYLLVNLALLYALPMSQLAASKFAGGDAMSLIFGAQSGQIVTILALLSLIGIINAIMMMAPRILFALGRDGLFTEKATTVNQGGTPVFALLTTALCVIVLSSVGTFELLLAIGQFFIVIITILLIVSLFILRRREPDTPRPFRAWGYPFAPLLMLVCAVLLFFGYIVSNPYPSLYAIALLAVSYPIYRLIKNKEIMKTKTPFLLSVILITSFIFSAHAINPKSSEKFRADPKTNCQSADFPSFVFSESKIFPKDKSLHHPEDGKALADGRIIVGDEEFGLRIIEKDGKSRPFGKFKEAGWIHNPPKFIAGPNGMFMESDARKFTELIPKPKKRK